MKKIHRLICGLVLLPVLNSSAFATQEYHEFDGVDATTSTGGLFAQLEYMVDNGTLFFGVVVVLAILVTGFFLGRKWLRRVG